MLEPGKLYKINIGNYSQTSGILVKGEDADVDVYVSQSKPSLLSDMVKITSSALSEGLEVFPILPQFIAVVGVAESIDLIGPSIELTNITFL